MTTTHPPTVPLPTADDFSASFDARDWARAFVASAEANPALATDEGTMLAWFANALMRGYDEHAAVARRSPDGAEQRLAWIRQRCRIVFYPGDLSYPIEHTLFASKDMWDALMAEYERENPVAPTREPTP